VRQSRTGCDAEQPFDAAATERAAAVTWKAARIHVDFRLSTNQIGRLPREPPANSDIVRVELTRFRGDDLCAGLESILRARGHSREHEDVQNHEGHEEHEVQITKITKIDFSLCVLYQDSSCPS